MGRMKFAIVNGATCSGCDIAILDINERILELVELGDVVFGPTIMDTKYEELEAMAPDEIDIAFYHGSIRNNENVHIAKVAREKARVLISFGSCPSFGGIPALANAVPYNEMFQVAYKDSVSTDNPEDYMPGPESSWDGYELTLPELLPSVILLEDVVDVDLYIPGCPPAPKLIGQALDVVKSGELPPKGFILASDKNLCEECQRSYTLPRRVGEIHRPHEIQLDREKCFLEQGVVCAGPATRGGCGARCTVLGNMPCRGCMGATREVVDQGGTMMSVMATILGLDDAKLTDEERDRILAKIPDPVGTFYRFGMAKSRLKKLQGGAA